MFSKLRSALAIGALTLLVGGCNFHFREAPSPEEAMQLGNSETGCLTGSLDKISRYMTGKADDQEITAVWSCLSRSLQLFSERTRGARPGVYTPEELRGFLEKYFLTDFHITDGLLREAMELKCTLLGGTPDVLTVEELNRTRQLVQVLNEQSLRLKTFIPLSFGWAESKTSEEIDEAVSALETAAQAVGRPLQKTGYPYFFSRFNALRKEVEEVMGRSTSSPVFRGVRDRMPFVRAMKSILVAPKGDRIDGHEWVNFLTASARWYGVALRFSHLQKTYPGWAEDVDGKGRARFAAILIDTLTLLDEAVMRHPGEVISFHELEQLIDALEDEELPFFSRTKGNSARFRPALKQVLRPVIQRLLGGSLNGREGRAAQGLTRSGLKRLVGLVEHWSEGQHYLERLFALAEETWGKSAEGYTADELLSLPLDEVLPRSEINPIIEDAAGALRAAIPKSPSLFVPGDRFISIRTPAPTRRNYYDLSLMNISYEAARLLLEGYAGKNQENPEKGLLLSEFHKVLADIEEIGVLIRFLDPKRDNQKMFTTRFTEGSLFTYASNGDEYLDLDEAAQLFPMLYSAFMMSENIHENAATFGCQSKGEDPFGKATYETRCYLDAFFANRTEYWERLPGMATFHDGLAADVERDFQIQLMHAARLPGSPPGLINSNDSIGFAGVVQYVDAMFSRFDKDASGTLDATEAKAAFPVFRGALKAVVQAKGQSRLIPDRDLEALFTYILAHSGPPSRAIDLPGWWLWKSKETWEFKTDRLGVLRIFAQLMQN